MNDEIRVHVVDKGRRNLYMRYLCPISGRAETRSTGTNKTKEAAKVAAKWEAELQEGRYQRTSRMPWDEFREFHAETKEPTVRPATAASYSACMNIFEKHCRPNTVSDLTTPRVTYFTAEMRKAGLAEATVASHLRHLKAVARWAVKQKLLAEAPSFDMPKKASTAKAKGRAITGEEFDRMLDAVPKALAKRTTTESVESWRTLLQGLWWSGLRLGEALALRFDDDQDGVSVHLDGQRSVLVFEAEGQKSGKTETTPLAPEAVELMESLPYRAGYVFRPLRLDTARPMARDVVKVGKVISAIGETAGVLVRPAFGVEGERGYKPAKHASAHDLRRSFGVRWSRRVMPVTLKELMRHASIETTMTFYVGQNAEAAAAELWRSVSGDTLGDTSPQTAEGVVANP